MLQSTLPRLRPHIVKVADPARSYRVVDRLGLAAPMRLTAEEFGWLDLFDGTRSLPNPAFDRRLALFAERLENNLLLEGERFRRIVNAPVRPPACIGCYEEDPELLRRQLAGLFVGPNGPGLPGPYRPGADVCAALIPHIDYPRGGATYAWGFKEIVEHSPASLFVIIGTSHYSQQRFTLTRKNFQTPLGIMETDQGYIDRLVSHYGAGLFDDEWLAHLPEHSIELEVVFLQYLYENKRPIRMVPLVVGSFFDCVCRNQNPMSRPDIANMVEALRAAQRQTPESICYIISGDLAHIGPKFDDAVPMTPSRLRHSREQDQAILRQAEAARPAEYFRVIADEGDSRNICGLPPTFTFMEAVRPQSGKLLHYDQYVDSRLHESVSFASMAFYQSAK
jgi:AmmeMemoRadiSam system protein B